MDASNFVAKRCELEIESVLVVNAARKNGRNPDRPFRKLPFWNLEKMHSDQLSCDLMRANVLHHRI